MSSEVRKLFINSSGSVAPYCSRRWSTCRAMMSRNDRPLRTQSSDLARSMPIEVPSPPLSLMTAVARTASAAHVVVDLDVVEVWHVDRLDARLGDHAGLTVLEQPVVVGEGLDRDLVHAGVGHLGARPVQPSTTHAVDRRLVAVHPPQAPRTGRETAPPPSWRCATSWSPRGGGSRCPSSARAPGDRAPPAGLRRRTPGRDRGRLRLGRARARAPPSCSTRWSRPASG